MVSSDKRFDLGLEGRRVLVTGAAQGLGRATAEWLAALGAEVTLADRQDCTEAARAAGNGARAVKMDLTDQADIETVVADMAAQGPLWGVVNCAGLLLRRPLEASTREEVELQQAVNQTGTFFLARAALAVMQKQGLGGRIILYSSQGGFSGGFNGSIPYAMTKAAVTALVKSLARAGGPDGITVNAVSPGAIDTAMFRGGMTQADIDDFTTRIPMGRIGEPDETAAPTAFLLSDWAGYVSGTTLHVNGAQYMA
ncbi:SDR family NAD(P)-dependent oxidoreductase [Roseisalinus antarcticus]|uniref:3-oxoacyl-[acyl-carrier-protein] reductase FabG n=1 Tax=Roseisalinus antarcticus TaxID=254357 RepID=A0A1Y5THZ5_9RHOB|nr:SDR family NAD(P)-dependent oxidoreductase [Roseisalinus antarcticus]SLN64541.1 3-oxoacyl-[acyl-carrier-protein] reductase FabG [Roseisalinus antarcticus]